jgi:hypothetical protein
VKAEGEAQNRASKPRSLADCRWHLPTEMGRKTGVLAVLFDGGGDGDGDERQASSSMTRGFSSPGASAYGTRVDEGADACKGRRR